jgi:hypothetical protein
VRACLQAGASTSTSKAKRIITTGRAVRGCFVCLVLCLFVLVLLARLRACGGGVAARVPPLADSQS